VETDRRKRRSVLAIAFLTLWLSTMTLSSVFASGPPAGPFRYIASRPLYYRPVPPRPPVQGESASPSNLHQWGAVTLFHGLPSDHVRAIAQDAEGVLWFGTDGGLAKYDGRRTQKVIDAGLPSGRVQVLKAGRDGVLWVGTDTGAARLVRDTFHSIEETAGQTITSINASEQGRTVLASAQGRVFMSMTAADGSVRVESIGPEKSPLLTLDSSAPLILTSVASVPGGLILGTRGRGLLTMRGGEIKEILSRPRPFFIEDITLDNGGHPWFGAETTNSDSGLYQSSDLLQPQKIGRNTGTVTSMFFDSAGDLWVGTGGQGVFHYRDSLEAAHFTFENTAGALRSNFVYSVFVDREGVVWLGTDRGVCRYDPRSPQSQTVSNHPESNFVRVLFQSADGRWWCGTNRGLFVREPHSSEWQSVPEMAARTIHAIAQDSTGRLLIGTAGGFYAGTSGSYPFTPIEKSEDVSSPAASVRAIAEFQGVTYLAAFGSGLERFDEAGRTVVWPLDPLDPLATTDARQREVISLHADGNDRLWIGTAEAGLFVFDGREVRHEDVLSELNGSPVWDIERAGDGALWLATGRGLHVYRSNKLVPVLSGSDARHIVVDDSGKAVWCATAGNGLFKIRLREHAQAMVLTRLDTEHGLPSNSIFTIFPERSNSDTTVLWLGTNRGITRYEAGTVAPVLHATRILPAGLNMEYPQNSFLLEVAARSSRTFPEQFQYSFSLAAAGSDIIDERISRDSQFLMDDLRPGRYRVVVRAFGNDLVPSDPLAFDFTVGSAPFPWTSAALSVLLGWALVALWYGYRQNRKLTQTNVALADTRRQLANETENERRRIARDLHDQTLSDLRGLLLSTDRLPAAGGDEPAVFRSEIESISTEIRRICEDLSPSVLANVGLTAALEFALSDGVAHLPAEEKFEYQFVCSDDLEERLHFDAAVQIQIYRIVQEAINNACRHAAASRVRLSVEIAGADFIVTLEDNGRGFDMTTRHGKASRGLTNIRSRASLIDAEVHWRTRPGGGVIFTLRKRT
jgi:signal transduction histidine kinase/ligand-binding sensor domain-containing protein